MAPSVVEHFDTCLGCMACETACPVRRAVRAAHRADTRGHRTASTPRPAAERLFRRLLFSRPALSRAPAAARRSAGAGRQPIRRSPALLKLLPARGSGSMLTLAPGGLARRHVTGNARAHAGVGRRANLRVGLLTGCVQRAFFGDVNQATARVLAAEGCEVHAPAHRDAAARWRSTPARTTGAGVRARADRRVRTTRRRRRSPSTLPAADRR